MSKKTWLIIGVAIAAVVIYNVAKDKPEKTNDMPVQYPYSNASSSGDYSASYYLTLADQYDRKAAEAQDDVEFAEEQLQIAINDQRGVLVCQGNVDAAKQLKEQYEQLAAQYRALAQQAGN